ncbi:MAG: replication initiator protein A [Oscillospiraceae bacterium]|nr:replication initiator protein A [Oscillospiraceae bacterium]
MNELTAKTRYITAGHTFTNFLMFPRTLLGAGMTATEIKLYLLLLDRARVSKKHEGWQDLLGQVFVIYPVRELAEDVGCSETSVKKALKELERRDLIERWRRGQGKANHIFVKLPDGDPFLPSQRDTAPPFRE